MGKYQELRYALSQNPTPGPWEGRTGGLDCGLATDCAIHTWERCIAQITDNPLNQRDMAYIAAAHPEAIRALLAERDALRDALKQYASPENWEQDEHGWSRLWLEPDSTSRRSYDGRELAQAALAQEEA